MDKLTQEMRFSYWTAKISECIQSGMSKKSWCLENDINEKQFYYWQRKIRKKACHEIQPAPPETGRFFELTPPALSPVSPTADMVLHVKGATLEIHNSASEVLLQSLWKVLYYAE